MRLLIILTWVTFHLLLLTSCGAQDDPQTFEIQGEIKQCTVIGQHECGLTVACEDDDIYECVTN